MCAKRRHSPYPLSKARQNIAYGGLVGFFFLRPEGGRGDGCIEYATAWKNAHIGITFQDMHLSLTARYFHLADNHIGLEWYRYSCFAQ
jgi:hypothetical protein